MPVLVNGRQLGVSLNGVFSSANTDPIFEGKLWTEAALSWNLMRAAAILDGIPASEFAPLGPNSSARERSYQDYAWDQYLHHGGNPAAKPYTSNHGWGIAVDVKTMRVAAWMLTHGAKYGWSHDEGARVGEWWHFRYVGGVKLKKPSMPWLNKDERRWVKEYDKLLHARKDPERRQVLRHYMHDQAHKIREAAHVSGWDKLNRRKRYRSLVARIS